MKTNNGVLQLTISLVCSALVAACTTIPTPDKATYPASWPPIAKATGGGCNFLFGTYVASDEESGARHLRTIAKTILRLVNEKIVADSRKLHMSQSTYDPKFIQIDAYNAETLIDTSLVPENCWDGDFSLKPEVSERRIGHSPGRPVNLDSHAANYWIYAVTTRVARFHQAEGYLVMSEVISECQREDFVAIFDRTVNTKRNPFNSIHEEGSLRNCMSNTNWYRLKRL